MCKACCSVVFTVSAEDTTETAPTYYVSADTSIANNDSNTGIFKFGDSFGTSSESKLENNTYYFNLYVRNTSVVAREYKTYVPSDDVDEEITRRTASTSEELYGVIKVIDSSVDVKSSVYWLESAVTAK